ncbi:MAG: uridine phosphorylase [Candidatus Bathyarchaeales archaeon]
MHKMPQHVQYHINCKRGDLAQYLLVPGDPDRAEKIVERWSQARKISSNREFRSFTGVYKGVKISAVSSGIGPAAMAIVVNEAANIGVETFIRVGSCGALQRDVECGDLVISSAAVRLDGTSNNYILPEYPATADYEVLLALIEAAESQSVDYHVGITATADDFYTGQARHGAGGFQNPESKKLIETLQRIGVLNFEMETATLFVISNLFGLRAGSVCAVYANRVTDEFSSHAGEDDCIRVANEAVKILDEWERKKKAKKKKYFFPSLLTNSTH